MSALDLLDEEERAALREAEVPEWTGPMLATLTDDRFPDPDWLFERKLDGERALVFREGGALRYAGKVGTGFTDELLERLHERLEAISRKSSPFDGEADEPEVTWVTPKLVAEIGFTEWTGDGRLRHPRFKGLRDDKDPGDVRRETPG